MFLQVCVCPPGGGVLSQHALQVVSQHALQWGGVLVLEGGWCLVLGGLLLGGVCSWGVSTPGGWVVETPQNYQAHNQGGNWGDQIQAHSQGGKLRGIRSRPTAKGEIEGGSDQTPPPWQLLLRAVRILLECVLVRSFFLRNFGITVIQDKPNGCWQICHFCVVGYLRKNSISIIFKRVSPLVQNHFIFVQFLRKNWPNYRFVSPMHYS